MAMIPGTIASRCLAVLADGPATTAEVALEVGISSHSAGTHMRNLWLRKKCYKSPFKRAGGRGRSEVCIWSLTPPCTTAR